MRDQETNSSHHLAETDYFILDYKTGPIAHYMNNPDAEISTRKTIQVEDVVEVDDDDEFPVTTIAAAEGGDSTDNKNVVAEKPKEKRKKKLKKVKRDKKIIEFHNCKNEPFGIIHQLDRHSDLLWNAF